jgi:AcrR family transcriptional regulator
MAKKEVKQDVKSQIMRAAEQEFLTAGYAGARTTNIAKNAGVTHAMLHYYFQSKENLFQKIFLDKVQTLTLLFDETYEQRLPFFETMRRIIEAHFEFIAKNPKLPYFILHEILSNKANRTLLIEIIRPKMMIVINKLEKMLADEIEKGTIRPVKTSDFIMNFVSINISFFLALPILEEATPAASGKLMEDMLNERKENNVQFILNGLRK